MAQYQIKNLSDFLPAWLPSNGAIHTIRYRLKDGSKIELALTSGNQFEVTEAHAIRHLDADQRFLKIS